MTCRVIASVLALLAVSAGIAYATIPDASSQYHACVLTAVGQVRIIDHDAGDNCKENEQHVHWSQSGPEGAGNSIRPLSRRGLVFVDEASEHVSPPNTLKSNDGF